MIMGRLSVNVSTHTNARHTYIHLMIAGYSTCPYEDQNMSMSGFLLIFRLYGLALDVFFLLFILCTLS